MNRVKIYEEREKKNQSEKEEIDYRQKIHEQNRANTEKMKKLKKFLKNRKDFSKSNEEFFEDNKEFFLQYGVKSYDELLKLINNYDKENPNELEKEAFEKFLKHLKIEKQLHEDGKNGFSILSKEEKKLKSSENFNNNLKISNNENLYFEKQSKNILSKGEDYIENGIPLNELTNSKLKLILGRFSEKDKINYQKVEDIIKDLNENKDNEFYNNLLKKNFCVDCDKSFDNDNGEESSLHCEHNLIQIEKSLANDLDEELNININELDYNSSLRKIYENLKKEQNKVLKYGKNILINFYADLLYYLYEIIVNNNSIKDLIESIIKINELYETKIKPLEGEVNIYFKNYFLFYVNRITNLSYYKLKKIEKLMSDLLDSNNIKKDEETDIFEENSESDDQNQFFDSFKVKRNDLEKVFENDNILKENNKQLEKEGNKKYFLRLGLDLKFKYGKNESINELYNKALENMIEPQSYEKFILKELNIV